MEGSLVRLPERDELDANIDESLVVEYYNKLLISISILFQSSVLAGLFYFYLKFAILYHRRWFIR